MKHRVLLLLLLLASGCRLCSHSDVAAIPGPAPAVAAGPSVATVVDAQEVVVDARLEQALRLEYDEPFPQAGPAPAVPKRLPRASEAAPPASLAKRPVRTLAKEPVDPAPREVKLARREEPAPHATVVVTPRARLAPPARADLPASTSAVLLLRVLLGGFGAWLEQLAMGIASFILFAASLVMLLRLRRR